MSFLRAIGSLIGGSISKKKAKTASIQYPLPTDGDSGYEKDIDIDYSDNGDFSGSIVDYFNSLKTVNTNITANNPKSIKVWLHRTIQTASIGFGCDDLSKSFSNVVVKVLGSGEVIRFVQDDYENDNTKFNSLTIDLKPVKANGFIIEFHTSDEICLSNLIIFKSTNQIARIQAVKPDNTVVDIGATNNDNLRVSVQEYGDTPAVDAFARLRVSENFTIFDSKQLHDKQPLFWDEEIGGAATSIHSSSDAATTMAVTANAADYVIRQTKQRFNYQPGKSQLVFFTFVCGCILGLTKRLGLFDGTGVNNLDPNNGIFLETTDTPRWRIAKSGTIAETAEQADWNVDRLDGTGPSGITIDLATTQIGVIDFEWLGVGRVRVGFVVGGLVVYCHYFNHANASFTSVYMSSPNLPLRYSIESDGTATGSLVHICGSVISEGGIEETGILRGVDTGASYITGLGNGVSYGLLGIRLKTTHLDITVIPQGLSVAIGTNDSFRWQLHLNPILAVGLVYSDLLNSSIQESAGSTANVVTTDGLIIGSGYGSTSARGTEGDIQTALRIGSTIAGARDELVLVLTPLSANMSAAASLTFRELL